MPVNIRQAHYDAIPTIQGMADVVFRLTYADILSPDQMEYMMEMMYSTDSLRVQVGGKDKYFYIAESDGIPAGFVSFELEGELPDGRPLYHLQKLYVMPDFQCKGLGSMMVEFVKCRLAAIHPAGCRVELNVNRNNSAVGFYERMGMRRDREGDFPIGHGYYMNDYIYAFDI